METSPIRLNTAPARMQILSEADPQESAFSVPSTSCAFIEANTMPTSCSEIRRDHIIPVFVKDNEPLISQANFIQVTVQAVRDVFRGEEILAPQIRVSHPIKGRTPDAKDKPAKDLQDWERTLYYERMMFSIEIPTMFDEIGGNQLTLIVGGVKAYNLDNLYNRKGAVEHFKLFVGFENVVCTNLCVRTDGYMGDLRVSSLQQLQKAIYQLLHAYDHHWHLRQLQTLTEYSITEQQFAQLIGRCRSTSTCLLPPGTRFQRCSMGINSWLASARTTIATSASAGKGTATSTCGGSTTCSRAPISLPTSTSSSIGRLTR